jgi:alkylated DNA nucleotide flippase Atl1
MAAGTDRLPTPYAERVLDLVERIPPGRVLAYGDVAAALGDGGPRQVGRVMALWGGGVPWWRVVRASGVPASGLEREAMARLRAEGAPMRADGARLDMSRARWAGPGTARGWVR